MGFDIVDFFACTIIHQSPFIHQNAVTWCIVFRISKKSTHSQYSDLGARCFGVMSCCSWKCVSVWVLVKKPTVTMYVWIMCDIEVTPSNIICKPSLNKLKLCRMQWWKPYVWTVAIICGHQHLFHVLLLEFFGLNPSWNTRHGWI